MLYLEDYLESKYDLFWMGVNRSSPPPNTQHAGKWRQI